MRELGHSLRLRNERTLRCCWDAHVQPAEKERVDWFHVWLWLWLWLIISLCGNILFHLTFNYSSLVPVETGRAAELHAPSRWRRSSGFHFLLTSTIISSVCAAGSSEADDRQTENTELFSTTNLTFVNEWGSGMPWQHWLTICIRRGKKETVERLTETFSSP